jgi:hypothetical protein
MGADLDNVTRPASEIPVLYIYVREGRGRGGGREGRGGERRGGKGGGGKGREGKGREGKGREGKGRERRKRVCEEEGMHMSYQNNNRW